MVEQLPDTWDGAVRWFLGGTVVFALGFEGVTMALTAQFLLSGLSFLIAMALLAFMVYWPPGGSLILLVVAVALLSFLGTMEVCKRRQLTWSPKMLTVGIGLMIVAVLCAGIGGAILIISVRQGALSSSQIEAPSKTVSYLSNGHFYAGSLSVIHAEPRFQAEFARHGKRGRLFLDDNVLFAGVMGPISWAKRPRMFLQEFTDFVAEQDLNVTLLRRGEIDGQKQWYWGPSTAGNVIYPWNAWHQGRLVFICDEGPPEYFYFIIDPVLSATEMPVIIGQERFDFATKMDESDGKASL